MGIGITGMSKATRLPCSNDEKCPCLQEDDEGELLCGDEVLCVDVPGRRKDPVKEGCYVAGRGGRTSSLDFNYSAYAGWIRRLSLMALGVEPEDVWDHPRRYRGQPFVELIAFPDSGGGAIGPITSAKLYDDFVKFAPKAKRYFATATPNVFGPAQVNQRSGKDQAHHNRTGLSAAIELAEGLAGTVSDWDEGENLDWMWESYQQFRRAFRLAKDAGIVVFY